MTSELKLALVLDGGGRFVSMLRVAPNATRLEGLPYMPSDKADNERLGLIADRVASVGSVRSFRLRGNLPVYGSGETVLVFKEESA